MATYKIEWIEVGPTSTGKIKAKVTLKDERGVQSENVTIWDNFPNFANLRPGTEVKGDIAIKQNGQYTNKTLYPERTNTQSSVSAPSWATGSSPRRSPTAITNAMNKKAEGIERSQDRKEEGIKVSSTARDATLITLAQLQGQVDVSDDIYQKEWKKWRQWLWQNWDVSDTDFPPF